MADTSTLLWSGAAGALAAGVVSVALNGSLPVSPPPQTDTQTVELLARLDAQDARLAALSDQLVELRAADASDEAEFFVADESPSGETAADETANVAATQPAESRRRGDSPPTVPELVAAGFAPDRAEAMLSRLDELALERLRLQHAANVTEDSAERRRLRNERAQLGRETTVIREEFGDADYDRFLYASGKSNRVKVRNVLRGSAAAGVDMQAGDLLVSLDGERLFGIRDLISRTRNSPATESFPLVIERDGQRFETFVPGGPLGVRVESARAEPGD